MIEPGMGADLRIAKAVGIPAKPWSPRGGECHRDCEPYGKWSPTTDIRHAMEAAKAVWLFTKHTANLRKSGIFPGREWTIGYWLKGISDTCEVAAATPELAICEAIEKLTETPNE